jgi:3-deoxy-D-manno-octulosonic-acid transferase
MYVLYSLALTILFLVLLPFFAWKALTTRKYFANFGERLGNLPRSLTSTQPTIWIHAVSVGEALASIPLIKALRSHLSNHRVVLSTTTLTGQKVARSRITDVDAFCYFPFDWAFSVRRALGAINPSVVVLMESELWPNFLRICNQKSIPVMVANGRISDRSFARAQRLALLMRRVYARISCFAMQTEADAQRARTLGAADDRVFVCGNLKYDLQPATTCTPILDSILTSDGRPLIVAASTVVGEDEIVLEAFLRVRDQSAEKPRLLIAPRHPERFDDVAALVRSSRLSCVRRSQLGIDSATGFDASRAADVIVLDSIGELSGIFRYAAVVFVGGSLVSKGGHNILEPAAVARPIVVGPHMENFRSIAVEFLERAAIIQTALLAVDPARELASAWLRVLEDPVLAETLGRNAYQVFLSQAGAAERVSQHVINLLEAKSTPIR